MGSDSRRSNEDKKLYQKEEAKNDHVALSDAVRLALRMLWPRLQNQGWKTISRLRLQVHTSMPALPVLRTALRVQGETMKVFYWPSVDAISTGFPGEAIAVAETIGEAVQQVSYDYDRQLKEDVYPSKHDDKLRSSLLKQLIKELLTKEPEICNSPCGFAIWR